MNIENARGLALLASPRTLRRPADAPARTDRRPTPSSHGVSGLAIARKRVGLA